MSKFSLNYILILLTVLNLIFSGCESEKIPTPPSQDSFRGEYGYGWISFDADSTFEYFKVFGNYKPSDQFATDSSSEGAGGFIKDTTLYGNKIQMLLTGYLQRQDSVNLKQYLLVIGLCDSSEALQPGEYTFTKNNNPYPGRNAYVYFVRTDSLHFYEILIPKNGKLSLAFYDVPDRHIQGSFYGTLWGLPPDTLKTLNITNGLFDLYLVDKFFNY